MLIGADREAIGEKISADTGAILVRPFDDPDIISGQGTVGLEIAQDMKELLKWLLENDVKTVLIGCEGGFSEDERQKLESLKRFRLDTPMILRSESAAMAIASKVLI